MRDEATIRHVASSVRSGEASGTHHLTSARHDEASSTLQDPLSSPIMTRAEPTYSGPQEDVAAILALVEEWDALTRAGNHAALLELVTEDCVFLAPGFPPMQGRASLSPLLAGFSAFRIEPLFEVQEILVSGDWAFLRAKDEIIATPIAGGEPRVAKGWAISILHRGADQIWRFARGINTKIESKAPVTA